MIKPSLPSDQPRIDADVAAVVLRLETALGVLGWDEPITHDSTGNIYIGAKERFGSSRFLVQVTERQKRVMVGTRTYPARIYILYGYEEVYDSEIGHDVAEHQLSSPNCDTYDEIVQDVLHELMMEKVRGELDKLEEPLPY